LGGPWVTQASPKGHASVERGSPKGQLAEVPLFATKPSKGWVAWARSARLSPEARGIADIARDRKTKNFSYPCGRPKDTKERRRNRKIHHRGRRYHPRRGRARWAPSGPQV